MMGTTKDGRVPASLQYAAEPANASAAGSSALGTTSSITMQSLGKIALTFGLPEHRRSPQISK